MITRFPSPTITHHYTLTTCYTSEYLVVRSSNSSIPYSDGSDGPDGGPQSIRKKFLQIDVSASSHALGELNWKLVYRNWVQYMVS
jgi:hypothetical protein